MSGVGRQAARVLKTFALVSAFAGTADAAAQANVDRAPLACGISEVPGGEKQFGHSDASARLRRAFDKAVADKRNKVAICLADEYLEVLQSERPMGGVLEGGFDHVVAGLETVGENEEAEARLDNFISSNARLGLARLDDKINRRARLLIKLGRTEEARKIVGEVLAHPQFASGTESSEESWYTMALAARASGNGAEALDYFGKIAAQAREFPTILDWRKLADLADFLDSIGRAKEAEAEFRFVIDSQTEFKQPDQPNAAGRATMTRYADFLKRRGRGGEARYHQLPLQIAEAVEARRSKEAQKLARELLAEARRLYKPTDVNYRRALQFHAAVIGREEQTYDLPPELRQCGPWPIPAPKASPSAPGAPMLVTSAPASPQREEKVYFQFSREPVSEADLKGGFRDSIGGLTQYAQFCAAGGDPRRANVILTALSAKGRALNYTPADLQQLYIAEAQNWVALDDFPKAEAAYLAAADSAFDRDRPSLFDSAKLFNEIVNFYLAYGQYERAEAQVLRFLETGAVDSDSANLATLHAILANIYVEQGKFAKATELILRNLRARPKTSMLSGDDAANFVGMLQNWNVGIGRYAMALNAAGKFDKTIALLIEEQQLSSADLKAANEAGKRVYDFDVRRTMRNFYGPLGDAYLGVGRFAEAAAAYRSSVEIENAELEVLADRQFALRGLYEALGGFALTTALSGERTDAARALDRAKEVRAALGRPNAAVEDRLQSASMILGISDPARRPEALDDGANLVTRLDRQWSLSQQSGIDSAARLRRLRDTPQYYARYASLLWANARDARRAAPAEQALRLLQRASLSTVDLALGASIARSILLRDKPDTIKLVSRREELARRYSARTARVDEAVLRQDYRSIDQPQSREIRDLFAEIQQVDKQLSAAAPDYFAFVGNEPLTLSEAQALLGVEEALLMLVPSADGTHALALTREKIAWRLLPITGVEAEAAMRRLLWFAGASAKASRAEVAAWTAEVGGGAAGFDRKTAHRLYQGLVAPMLPELAGKKHLFIAGSGALSQAPFGILVSAEPRGGDDDPASLRETRWLADDFALLQLPSLQTLALLRRYGDAGASKADTFLGIGDPQLEGAEQRRGLRGLMRSGEATSDTIDASDPGSGRIAVDLGQLRKLGNLPGTARELAEMASAFGQPQDGLLIGKGATEPAVRRRDLRNVEVLAFATHGLMRGEAGATEPGLVLTPPSVATSEDDGYLAASEVAQLRLAADWVILSACNSAAGDGSRGSFGFSGLAQAFFYAGARNLLASHWPVRDDVAAELTVRIIKIAREESGLTRAQAFQKAMRLIRNDASKDGKVTVDGVKLEKSWAHPNAWAPFSLIGQGSR